ncbi:hypothetical protein AMTRI_Chr04g188990 [Amborella trichopoda]
METEDSNPETRASHSSPAEKQPDQITDPKASNSEEIIQDFNSLNVTKENSASHGDKGESLGRQTHEAKALESESPEESKPNSEEGFPEEKVAEPVFDGTENPELEATKGLSSQALDSDSEVQSYVWPEKATALKNYVKEKGAVAVSTVLRRLSGKRDDNEQSLAESEERSDYKNAEDGSPGNKPKELYQKAGWNPLSLIRGSRDSNTQVHTEQGEDGYQDGEMQESAMKGRVILYTRLRCPDCREMRSFLRQKGLRSVEINIDIFPSRKLELEKNTGSSSVPKIFFNDLLIGSLKELTGMDESGKLDETINNVLNMEPSLAAAMPPFPGEDDVSSSGMVDEFAIIVRKMKEIIVVKDRFYKMRRFSNCFLGSEAVDFLSEDQYLEREDAVEFGRKLVSKHFFRHILDENIFEDGNHFYRFLEHDPIVMGQCYNLPKAGHGNDVKPKPLNEIASRLRFLSFGIFEAYVSEDGRHVDYRAIRCSEEFARYLRITEELPRVELLDISREEKLAFFINLYNMMAIHAILWWGYPAGALERRKLLGDFKYVVGGSAYSLSAIQNGILRGNQRPPYNLMKPFGLKDPRSQVALPYPEPLVHFALVCGTRSGPALQCYSPGDIDQELMEAARNFIRNGGLVLNAEAKTVFVSKILSWYSVDFGKIETEVIKHAANYLETSKSEELLELLAGGQLKVVYQPYDWGLNC